MPILFVDVTVHRCKQAQQSRQLIIGFAGINRHSICFKIYCHVFFDLLLGNLNHSRRALYYQPCFPKRPKNKPSRNDKN